MKKQILTALGKISLSNNNLREFGDGFEAAMTKSLNAVREMELISFVPKLGKDMLNQTIDSFEVHPCTEINEEGDVEQCEPKDAQFWSVYVHYKGGGLDCIADCDTEGLANDVVNFLTILIKNFKPE